MALTSNEMCKLLMAMKKMLPKYSPEIDQSLGLMWCKALEDFSEEQIKKAFQYAIKNLTEWPPAAMIKSLCLGVTKTDADIGQEVSSIIYKCILDCGAPHFKQAKEKMGELAWQVVTACGGWYAVCSLEFDQIPSAKKQWRELASSFHKGYLRDGGNKAHKIHGNSVVPDFLLD